MYVCFVGGRGDGQTRENAAEAGQEDDEGGQSQGKKYSVLDNKQVSVLLLFLVVERKEG